MSLDTAKIALLLTVMTFLKSSLSFLAQATIAREFGAGASTDAYFLSLYLPQVIGDFMIGGALIFALVPVSIGLKEKEGAASQREFHAQIFLRLLLISLAGAGFYFILAPQILPILGRGFDARTLQMAVRMARELSLLIVLWSVSYLFFSIFLIEKRFFVYTWGTAISPLVFSAFCLLMPKNFGEGRLVYGILLGALTQTVFAGLLCRHAFRFNWARKVFFENRKVFELAAPIALGVIVSALIPFQQKFLASTFGQGGVSCLNYAFSLYAIPGFLIFGSLQAVLYPKFSGYAATHDPRTGELLARTLRFVIFISVPVSLLAIVFCRQLVFLFFERGLFEASDATLTASVLRFLLVGFFAQASNEMFARAYYAKQKPWTYVKILVLTAGVAVILNPLLFKGFGLEGLTLMSTLASIISFSCLLFLYARSHEGFRIFEIYTYLTKIVFTSLMVAGGVLAALRIWPSPDVASFWNVVAVTALWGGSGMALYLGFCVLLKLPEAKLMMEFMRWSRWRTQ